VRPRAASAAPPEPVAGSRSGAGEGVGAGGGVGTGAVVQAGTVTSPCWDSSHCMSASSSQAEPRRPQDSPHELSMRNASGATCRRRRCTYSWPPATWLLRSTLTYPVFGGVEHRLQPDGADHDGPGLERGLEGVEAERVRVAGGEPELLQGLRGADAGGAGVVGRVGAGDVVELGGQLVDLHCEVFVDGEDLAVDGDGGESGAAEEVGGDEARACVAGAGAEFFWSKIGARLVQSTDLMAVFGRTPWANWRLRGSCSTWRPSGWCVVMRVPPTAS
jgi:hypothetical protein